MGGINWKWNFEDNTEKKKQWLRKHYVNTNYVPNPGINNSLGFGNDFSEKSEKNIRNSYNFLSFVGKMRLILGLISVIFFL